MYYLLVEYALFICVIRLQHDDGDDDLRVCISFFLVAHQVCVCMSVKVKSNSSSSRRVCIVK